MYVKFILLLNVSFRNFISGLIIINNHRRLNMKILIKILLIFCISLTGSLIYGRDTENLPDTSIIEQDTIEVTIKEGIDFFGSDELLQITLQFDIRDFLKNKSLSEYYDANIAVKIDENDSISQDIRLKSRGKMRLAFCDFPPILLNFKSSGDKSGTVQKKGKLKLVTHCKNSSLHETYLLKEYLIYRLYSLVTPYSFKTRLVMINYVDKEKVNKVFTEYGFLIEDEDKMAERHGAEILKTVVTDQNQLSIADMLRTAVFQYMIGNTDWTIPNQHNIKNMKSIDVNADKVITVPFDFDLSGFVDAYYSAPVVGVPITDVKERYYRGFCTSKEELAPIIEEFGTLKEPFLKTIDNFEYTKSNLKKQMKSYIESFYEMYTDKNLLIDTIISTCREF